MDASGHILFDYICRPVGPVGGEGRVLRRHEFHSAAIVHVVPGVQRRDRADAVGGDETRPAIEFLRIEAVPPRALAVGLGQRERVVALACPRASGVVPVGRLTPMPRVRSVVATPEAPPAAAHRLLPWPANIDSPPTTTGVPTG